MDSSFTAQSFPEAVRWLFETNGYEVDGPVQVAGAEVDLVATQQAGLRETKVYIEATVAYVDTTKYGKDLTKLIMFQGKPDSQALIVSATGFTVDVRERAKAAGIDTFTYDELFRHFEKTEPYLRKVLSPESDFAQSLVDLDAVYEEPEFVDSLGRDEATAYLTTWMETAEVESPWLVVVGEYGTGKTALTRVLQRRWSQAYRRGEARALPLRIELRDFAKQFNARGLLHHFLDENELAHIPVTFLESMIARGSVVLLLDGYDEMAQYLNIRERRACLEALAELASSGARGILTSRPNYFSEAEELRVFEVLYQNLTSARSMTALDLELVAQEKRVDEIFKSFLLERRERRLRDLSRAQTEMLVRRRLGDDVEGADLIVRLLDRIFRWEVGDEDADPVSLSGKPVIVSYLLEVVSELKEDAAKDEADQRLTEWQVFDLIVAKLMRRDWQRTANLIPAQRRAFLEELALVMTLQQEKSVSEETLREVVVKLHQTTIRRRAAEGDSDYTESLVEDLRSSSTLTRSASGRTDFRWAFSHNSLREFLLTERLLASDVPVSKRLPITDPMRQFASSLPAARKAAIVAGLATGWPTRPADGALEQVLSLTWQGILGFYDNSARTALAAITGEGLDLRGARLRGMTFSSETRSEDLSGLKAYESEFTEVSFVKTDLHGAAFQNSVLDGCDLRGANLAGADFSGSLLLDCNITGAFVTTADFRQLYDGSSCLVSVDDGITKSLEGNHLLGLLASKGALTDKVEPYFILQHLPGFDICEKVCRNLSSTTWSQRRGLEQRGASVKDVPLARRFVGRLEQAGLIQSKGGAAALVGPTPVGRVALLAFVQDGRLESALEKILVEELNLQRLAR